jgi:predicted ATPase
LSVVAEVLTEVPGRITWSAFIGRQVELESLLEVFDGHRTAPRSSCSVAEAGIGKTRLISEFAGHLPEARVLVGACLELGQAVMPYLPLAGILRQLSRKIGFDDEMRRTHALRPVLAELSRLPLVLRIELQPMDEDDVLQLLTAIRGNQSQPEEAVSMLTRSEGNPSTSKSCSLLATRRALECRRACGTFWLTGWTDVHGYRFRHALLQEAAHDQLLPVERTRLHRAFVDTLQADPSLAAGGIAGVDARCNR